MELIGLSLQQAADILKEKSITVENIFCMKNGKQLNHILFCNNEFNHSTEIENSKDHSNSEYSGLKQENIDCGSENKDDGYGRFSEIVVRARIDGGKAYLVTTYFLMENFNVRRA